MRDAHLDTARSRSSYLTIPTSSVRVNVMYNSHCRTYLSALAIRCIYPNCYLQMFLDVHVMARGRKMFIDVATSVRCVGDTICRCI